MTILTILPCILYHAVILSYFGGYFIFIIFMNSKGWIKLIFNTWRIFLIANVFNLKSQIIWGSSLTFNELFNSGFLNRKKLQPGSLMSCWWIRVWITTPQLHPSLIIRHHWLSIIHTFKSRQSTNRIKLISSKKTTKKQRKKNYNWI